MGGEDEEMGGGDCTGVWGGGADGGDGYGYGFGEGWDRYVVSLMDEVAG